MKKFELLEKTAASILATPEYRWSSPSRCNLGLLIEIARGSRATRDEFFQGGTAWIPRSGCLLWSARGTDNHIIRWLKVEHNLTAREIESIELINDRSIVNLLRRRGIPPAGLFNRSRKYVAAYIAAMAAREKRRAGRRPAGVFA